MQLFYLPYILKCEISLNLKENLGFKVTTVAFSLNEKLVIVGDDRNLAVAAIEGMKDFYHWC